MICNHLFGFLALATYIATLIPSNISKIFPHTKKWQINRFLLSKRRLLGLMVFSLSVSHTLISLNKYNINLLHGKTYSTYYTGIVSLMIFGVLAFTSNNWSMRHLKHKWKILHQLTYVAMFLLLWHILMMTQDSWTWITPIALQSIAIASLIFLTRLIINSKKILIKTLQLGDRELKLLSKHLEKN